MNIYLYARKTCYIWKNEISLSLVKLLDQLILARPLVVTNTSSMYFRYVRTPSLLSVFSSIGEGRTT